MNMRNEDGFTLVELMVVVAIIGILSAVAIPNFRTYQAKSKTSEARLQLASLYSAEISFAADFDSFATCLSSMGYTRQVAPLAVVPNTYYAVGFGAAFGTDNINGSVCANANRYYLGGRSVGGATAVAGFLNATSIVNAAGDQFLAEASGPIDANFNTAANANEWTITQDKILTQTRQGY